VNSSHGFVTFAIILSYYGLLFFNLHKPLR
jgi:hypothetical protein